MKINLRKANAIQLSITEALKNLNFESSVSINEFQKPEPMVAAASERFSANIRRREKLIDVLYGIRKAVAAANNSLGINERLADVARFEKDIVFYTTYAKAPTRQGPMELAGKLDKIRTQPADRAYYADKEVTSSVFTEENIEAFRKAITYAKKQKQALQDELLELNISTKITLTEEDIKVLTDESIL